MHSINGARLSLSLPLAAMTPADNGAYQGSFLSPNLIQRVGTSLRTAVSQFLLVSQSLVVKSCKHFCAPA